MTRAGGFNAAIVAAVTVLAGPVGCATAAYTPPPPRVLWKPDVSPTVAFSRDAQGRIILQGAVSGRPATIHLDSGAVGTLVDEPLINTSVATRVEGAILNGGAEVARWGGVRIDLGPLSVEPDRVVAVDRAGRAQVLTGNAIFDDAVIDVDYEASRVTFLPPASFTPPEGATALPLARDDRRVTARVSINDEPPICVGVDLGFNGALALAPSVVQTLRLETNPEVDVIQEAPGREPIRTKALKRIDRVRIAGFELTNVSASLGGHTDTACGSLLGAELLSGFHLYFDFSRDTLWLTPRAYLSSRFETNLGVTYRNTPTGMLVTAISQDSPAQGLLQVGDRISRIDGDPPIFTLSTGEQRRPPARALPGPGRAGGGG